MLRDDIESSDNGIFVGILFRIVLVCCPGIMLRKSRYGG